MNPSHESQLGKLNRITGQIDGVKRMISENQYCVDILTQIRAARSAMKSVELAVLETHMNSCLNDVCSHNKKKQTQKVEEIMKLLKKYE